MRRRISAGQPDQLDPGRGRLHRRIRHLLQTGVGEVRLTKWCSSVPDVSLPVPQAYPCIPVVIRDTSGDVELWRHGHCASRAQEI